jgi:hypothetical protein
MFIELCSITLLSLKQKNGVKHSSLLQQQERRRKKFYKIDTWCQNTILSYFWINIYFWRYGIWFTCHFANTQKCLSLCVLGKTMQASFVEWTSKSLARFYGGYKYITIILNDTCTINTSWPKQVSSITIVNTMPQLEATLTTNNSCHLLMSLEWSFTIVMCLY